MCVYMCVLVAQLCLTHCDSVDCSPPGSSVQGFPRQEYWSGLPFPSPEVFLTQGLTLCCRQILNCAIGTWQILAKWKKKKLTVVQGETTFSSRVTLR